MNGKRTRHSAAFKAKVALEALREQETVPELSRRHKVHANQIYKWKRQLLENVAKAFEAEEGGGDGTAREAELLQKIGELTVERDFCHEGSVDPGSGPVGRWWKPETVRTSIPGTRTCGKP